MKTYRIHDRKAEVIEYIEAQSFEEAATAYLRKALSIRRNKLHARRVTGYPGLSGMFAAYEPVRRGQGSYTQRGHAVHVSEEHE